MGTIVSTNRIWLVGFDYKVSTDDLLTSVYNDYSLFVKLAVKEETVLPH